LCFSFSTVVVMCRGSVVLISQSKRSVSVVELYPS
jgi:hypothetical protein